MLVFFALGACSTVLVACAVLLYLTDDVRLYFRRR